MSLCDLCRHKKENSALATIVGVTSSAGLPGLGLSLTLVLSSINCETQLQKVERDMQILETAFLQSLKNVFHPLKAGTLFQHF